MLERADEYHMIFDDICLNVPIYTRFSIEPAEWEAAQVILDMLKAFRDASVMMSGSHYPTLSLSLYNFLALLAVLDTAHKSAIVKNFPNVKAGIDAAKGKLIKFFDKSTAESEYYYFAAVLDPRFKDRMFSAKTTSTTKMDSTLANQKSRGLKFNLSILGISASHESKDVESAELELKRYLAVPVADVGIDPLMWWHTNQNLYPRCALMARKILAILSGDACARARCSDNLVVIKAGGKGCPHLRVSYIHVESGNKETKWIADRIT
ncbi:uncharacterized protein EI90DRAFT_2481377 [Cantharellus anzutake]|uniref:uncharacterized protein n=1 Tax=Cantharellus anzutake TaxID=1750568 RepID=UPI0019077A87|nr:uncharacterized protein EI90DRAFT_2481377 [Cantharellus anzutake]KAF8322344.1 hypothetical protein EI90DRAFT_2481377 [Cantharellus anzutake]